MSNLLLARITLVLGFTVVLMFAEHRLGISMERLGAWYGPYTLLTTAIIVAIAFSIIRPRPPAPPAS